MAASTSGAGGFRARGAAPMRRPLSFPPRAGAAATAAGAAATIAGATAGAAGATGQSCTAGSAAAGAVAAAGAGGSGEGAQAWRAPLLSARGGRPAHGPRNLCGRAS